MTEALLMATNPWDGIIPVEEQQAYRAYVEGALALICEAEAATIVNNCAAALLLIVQHFTRKAGRARTAGAPEVVISRG